MQILKECWRKLSCSTFLTRETKVFLHCPTKLMSWIHCLRWGRWTFHRLQMQNRRIGLSHLHCGLPILLFWRLELSKKLILNKTLLQQIQFTEFVLRQKVSKEILLSLAQLSHFCFSKYWKKSYGGGVLTFWANRIEKFLYHFIQHKVDFKKNRCSYSPTEKLKKLLDIVTTKNF